MVPEKGNALFLILIAVALFAALSYAVTQSSRGGGAGVDDEKVSLLAAELMQQAALIHTGAMRLKIKLGSGFIEFNSTANGLFNVADGGITTPIPPEALYGGAGVVTNLFGWTLARTRIMVNGVHQGTTGLDEVLMVGNLSQSACAEINSQLYGSATIPTYTEALSPPALPLYYAYRDGTYFTAGFLVQSFDVSLLPGCSVKAGYWMYFDVLSVN